MMFYPFIIFSLGVVYLTVGVFYFVFFEYYSQLLKELLSNPKFVFIDSFFNSFVGALLILFGISGTGWQFIIIDILGAAALFKGFSMMIRPDLVVRSMVFCAKPTIFSIFLSLVILVGIFLLGSGAYLFYIA